MIDDIDNDVWQRAMRSMFFSPGMGSIKIEFDPYCQWWSVRISFADNSTYEGIDSDINEALRIAADRHEKGEQGRYIVLRCLRDLGHPLFRKGQLYWVKKHDLEGSMTVNYHGRSVEFKFGSGEFSNSAFDAVDEDGKIVRWSR